jgi:hypothetical protein
MKAMKVFIDDTASKLVAAMHEKVCMQFCVC